MLRGASIKGIIMKMTHYMNDNICIVSVGEYSFLDDASEFKKYVKHLYQTEIMTGMIINLKKASMLNSSGLGEIVFLHRKLENEHISFALCELNLHIQQLFSISNFDKVIQIYHTQEEALRGLLKKPLIRTEQQLDAVLV